MVSNEAIMKEMKAIKKSLLQIELGKKEVFTLDEAVKYSGISKNYLYKLSSRGDLPVFKPTGKLIYIDRKDLIAFLRRFKKNESIDAGALADSALKDYLG